MMGNYICDKEGHRWLVYYDGNFASDTFGELGATCLRCYEKIGKKEINNRLRMFDLMTIIVHNQEEERPVK